MDRVNNLAKASIALVSSIWLLSSCDAAQREEREISGDPSPTSASPTDNSDQIEELRSRVQIAWTKRGEDWERVFRIPVGAGRQEAGVSAYPDQAPILPSAFAVSDAGVWVLDPAKGRLCLFSMAGELVEAYPGVSQVASDLALGPDGSPWLIDVEPEGRLLHLVDGRLEPVSVGTAVYTLASTPDDVLGSIGSFDFVDVDDPVDPGQALGGIPVGEGLLVTEDSPQGKELVLAGAWAHQIDLRANRRPFTVTASFGEDVTVDATRVYLGIRPGSTSDLRGWESPLYLFIISLDDGRLVEARRIEASSMDTTNQMSDFAVHDGTVYQLFVTEAAVVVRRMRP